MACCMRRTAALLVVPDALDVEEISLMAEVVLRDLGFRALAVHVESVAAAFAHGAPVSCVVNVGAQSSSVVCVEDGCALPASRIFLPYGGDDLSQTLWWLLAEGGAGGFLDGLGASQGAAVLDACPAANGTCEALLERVAIWSDAGWWIYPHSTQP